MNPRRAETVKPPPRRSAPAGLETSTGGFRADYDATAAKRNRRQEPRNVTYREDKHLDSRGRKTLLATSRDQVRNLPIAGWALRKRLDYVGPAALQMETDDDDFNDRVEKWWRGWTENPERCHAGGLKTARELVKLAESGKCLDGDTGLLMRDDGRVQLIESDLICDPTNGNRGPDGEQWVIIDGVHIDPVTGRHLHYAVHTRGKYGTEILFERWIPAQWMILHGNFFRHDQTRGIPIPTPGINTAQDLYECGEAALLKMKLTNILIAAVKRKAVEGMAPPPIMDPDRGNRRRRNSEPRQPRYEFRLSQGAAKLELDENDELDIVESNQPSNEFQTFFDRKQREYLLGWDIPYTFYDTKGSTYSANRQELLAWMRSIEPEQDEVVLKIWERFFQWQFLRAVANGELTLPAGMTLDDLPHEWIVPEMPWIDPLKEIQAEVEAERVGATSQTSIARRLYAADFRKVSKQRSRDRRILRESGLPPPPAPASTPATESTVPPRDADDVDAPTPKEADILQSFLNWFQHNRGRDAV